MLKNKNIICISYTTWEGEYTKSTVQLLSLLAFHNNVLFIEYPRTVKDLINGIRGKINIPVKRMLGLEKRVQTIEADTGAMVKHMVMPPVLPTNSIKNEGLLNLFYRWNTKMYRRQIRKIQKKFNLKDSIILTAFNPVYGLAMIGELDEHKNIYYCYDGMDLDRNNARTIALEKEFCKKVDGIITTSEYLNNEKKQYNSNSVVVKNGVDYDLFVPFAKTKVNDTTKKKVGYTGSIDYRFDVDLVEYAVQELPDVTFEFTGGIMNQPVVDRLSKYDNVVFNPAVHASEVPDIVSKFDVGIIPYIKSEINKNIYPLKINEYLAIGVPVIMTEFAVLKDFYGIANVIDTQEEFVKQIKDQIQNDSEALIKKRIEFAKSNSWDKRAELFGSYLNQFTQ
ncbi:MAG: glycosyltransferase [Winogradskyella sp.]|uniref:glycosyltransferase n=1 Tax=Winogradskyella sp. TaxID=1883156 RepID=UPI0025D607C9|nr:glycosyltransferase [Winogradskyella sp.]NRB60272.1 glycosyltransferase [Winogradskyella sp.]